MGARRLDAHPSTLECIDQDPDYIPGGSPDGDAADFYFTVAYCDAGLQCPPYRPNKPITCIVCTQ